MAYTSEIEKLERRYAENPKGRNFAPLADAYRKAGEVDKAIELCRTGLELHPDYVSAHIVYGRSLIDKKDDAGAAEVFQKVLDLDPENILALKVLADIAERNGRYAEATRWMERLVLADPMNSEAGETMSRIRTKASQAQAVTPPMGVPAVGGETLAETPMLAEGPVAELLPPDEPLPPPLPVMPEPLEIDRAAIAAAPTTAMGRPEFELERASEMQPRPSAAAAIPGGGELEVFDGTIDFSAPPPPIAGTEGLQLEEAPVVEPEPAMPIEGLARTQYEGSGVFKLDSEPPPEQAPIVPVELEPPPPTIGFEGPEPSPTIDLPLILPEDLAPLPPRRSAERVSAPVEPVPALHDDDGAADARALADSEPVVTETMAELYLKQGHREDALRVYQALAGEHPEDERLQKIVADLAVPATRTGGSVRQAGGRALSAALGSGRGAGDFLRNILRARPGAAPVTFPEPVGAAVSALDEAFGTAAEPEPPPEPRREQRAPIPMPGKPTREASDAISLDSVFGEETVPVAEPAVGAPAARAGFSFDDFFGAPSAGGASAAPEGKGAAAKPRPSGRQARSQEDAADLDQFQAWLKSLKA